MDEEDSGTIPGVLAPESSTSILSTRILTDDTSIMLNILAENTSIQADNNDYGDNHSILRNESVLENNRIHVKNTILGDKSSMPGLGEIDARWDYYSKVLLGLARNPGGLSNNNTFIFPPATSPVTNLTVDLSSVVRQRDDPGRLALILVAYTLIICVSVFGNVLVCHVVVRTRRLHTLTHTLLANLAFSDLLMTALNIPFNVARVLLSDWPFGSVMCSLVPFVQVTSVYVSAFTMVAIALDRYQISMLFLASSPVMNYCIQQFIQVIVHPLKPRVGRVQGTAIIVVIWLLAALLSLPYALYSQVVEVFTYRRLIRCQARYPAPALEFRRWLTLATFLTQYAVPLCVTAVAYVGVTRRVWWRDVVGAATREQLSLQLRAKKKTVKMLVVVVVLFAMCWLPLNTYHLVVDFGSTLGPSRHSSTIFFICHWFAMSNVCYNPFIYCWLNDHFRAGARAWLWCVARKICPVSLSESGDAEEPRDIPLTLPQNSLTLSSALTSGSVRSKMSGSQRSSKCNNACADFHIALTDLISDAEHNQLRSSYTSCFQCKKQCQKECMKAKGLDKFLETNGQMDCGSGSHRPSSVSTAEEQKYSPVSLEKDVQGTSQEMRDQRRPSDINKEEDSRAVVKTNM